MFLRVMRADAGEHVVEEDGSGRTCAGGPVRVATYLRGRVRATRARPEAGSESGYCDHRLNLSRARTWRCARGRGRTRLGSAWDLGRRWSIGIVHVLLFILSLRWLRGPGSSLRLYRLSSRGASL
jgi:hypothetical protein